MGLPPPLGRVAKPDACPASSAGTSEDKFSALDARTAPSHLPRPRSTRTLTALIRIQARYLSPMPTLRPASTRPPGHFQIQRVRKPRPPDLEAQRLCRSGAGRTGRRSLPVRFLCVRGSRGAPAPLPQPWSQHVGGQFRRFLLPEGFPRGGGSGRLPALVPADLKGEENHAAFSAGSL